MASYTDLIYAKLRHAEPRFSGPKDFSLAMLDMANSDFRDDYATLERTIARHLGVEEPDASIYNAKFLNRLAQDFPQYLHVIDATDPCDSNNIKDTYDTVIQLQQQSLTTRRVAGNKKRRLSSMKTQTRLRTVFQGSYDEQHASRKTSRIDQADDASHEGEMAPRLPLTPQSIDNGDDSDPDYVDVCEKKRRKRSHQFSGGQGSRWSPSAAATINKTTLRDSESPVPALSPGGASSPELDLIQTPAVSPISTFLDNKINGNDAEGPGSRSPCGLSKDDEPSERLVASWGSDRGRFCHPFCGGFECSCGHRTGTLGDMTRHWQSKRHSEAAFPCRACGKAYTREDALKRHIRRNDECARKTRRIRSLSS